MLPKPSSPSGEAANILPSIMSPFLRLPRELRNNICEYHFRSEDGYVYNFEANKLIQDDGQRISLSLTRTCHQIRSEVEGLALRVSNIVFTTTSTEASGRDATLYPCSTECVEHRKLSLLNQMALPLLDAKMADSAAMLYPQFRPMLDSWQTHGESWQDVQDNFRWGEPHLIWRDHHLHSGLNLRKPETHRDIARPNTYVPGLPGQWGPRNDQRMVRILDHPRHSPAEGL
jgi:hypothetical protein